MGQWCYLGMYCYTGQTTVCCVRHQTDWQTCAYQAVTCLGVDCNSFNIWAVILVCNLSCLLLSALPAVPLLLLFVPYCCSCPAASPVCLCNAIPTPTGLGGAGVLDALNPLLQQQLADARGKSKPYHFIVFEAGINDILMKNQKAPEIFERM